MNREQQIQMEIGTGNKNHKKLVPLIDQRNKHEEYANRAMIVGMLLRKDDHKHGQPLMMYAHQQRLQAQETQRQMNKIQSEGHLDPHLEQQIGEKN